MLNNICIVDKTHLNIYTFAADMEEAEQKWYKAIEQCQESIKTWQGHCEKYPDTELFKTYLEQEKTKKYEIMGYHDFLKLEREHYLNMPLQEITEERFHEQLNVLPPIKWCTIDGIEMFCMSEMLTGCYTSQYLHDESTDKFYHKIVDITDKKTWGYNFI